MSKDDSSTGGLFSKMVRFVRNPAASWTDSDANDADRESQYSKLVLKEMIERKRRNDFVRLREFEQLRKLRQRDALTGKRTEDPAARPSFFESSLTSPIERAGTIKKIDEIEAQMSMQWWKGKQNESSLHPRTASMGLAPGQSRMRTAQSDSSFAATALASMPVGLEPQAAALPLFADDSMEIEGFGGISSQLLAPGAPSFGSFSGPATWPLAGEAPAEFIHEPDLEEAALLFANADDNGATAYLIDMQAQHANDVNDAPSLEIGMALFDLYRATGQQEDFENLALDFATRFNRSAPLWFSIPEQLGLVARGASQVAAATHRDFTWHAPVSLGVSSVVALQASLARTGSPWTFIWDRLASIEEAALPLLVQEFTRWANLKVQLILVGVDQLHALLQAHTQSGDRSGNPEWWRLRMAALHFMGRPDDFEMAALDYCVTYEVSPPSWSEPLCNYQDASQNPEAILDLLASGAAAGTPEASLGHAMLLTVSTGLSGNIQGDISALLQSFESRARTGEILVIPCDQLIRIDFAAAGSVLNWTAAQQAQKREVEFHNLHRLAAVFFNVVGISEHAWVTPRKN